MCRLPQVFKTMSWQLTGGGLSALSTLQLSPQPTRQWPSRIYSQALHNLAGWRLTIGDRLIPLTRLSSRPARASVAGDPPLWHATILCRPGSLPNQWNTPPSKRNATYGSRTPWPWNMGSMDILHHQKSWISAIRIGSVYVRHMGNSIISSG